MVRVTDSADSDWWWGECNNREGWFSTAFVRGTTLFCSTYKEFL